VKQDGTRPVPMHLRNAPTQLMKQLDYGKGYRYAHDEEGGFAAGERYLPDGMAPPAFTSRWSGAGDQAFAADEAQIRGKTPPPMGRNEYSLQSRPQTRTAAFALAGFLLDGSRAQKAAPIPVSAFDGNTSQTKDFSYGHFAAADHQRSGAGQHVRLVALGYTMVYGIINLINFAHGEVLMVGALTSWRSSA
jgi:hypothetical protein